MRGRRSSEYDPEIVRTARANRKVVRLLRLSQSVPPSARTQIPVPELAEAETATSPKSSIMGDPQPPPARPKLGDYGLANHRGRLTHTFQPANPVAFDIKTSVQNGLKERQYDGSEAMRTH